MTWWRESGTGLDRTDDADLDRAVTAYWHNRTTVLLRLREACRDHRPADDYRRDREQKKT